MFFSLWSTLELFVDKYYKNNFCKKDWNQFKEAMFVVLGLSCKTFQFFVKKEAIFSVFKLQTRYLIFQSMYGLWSGAKIKQFKEIISYCGVFC